MRKGSMELPILEQGQIRSVEKNTILSTDFESGFLGNFRLGSPYIFIICKTNYG